MFDDLFAKCQPGFRQVRTWVRAKDLAYGLLNCMGRSTITGWLCAAGLQFKDWTSAYRLFKGGRMDIDKLFSVVRKEVVQCTCPDQDYIFAHMDDTLFRKTGKKVSGSRWMRDPLGPPFQTNLVWGQRFIQLSLSAVTNVGAGPSRAIPVDLHHCPSALKPKSGRSEQEWEQYLETKKKMKLSVVGSQRIKILREQLDLDNCQNKTLVICVDGSYTNESVLKTLPDKVTIIGRIRKDSKLYKIPEQLPSDKGRKRIYGEQLPTPEQIRKSDEYTWQKVEAWAAGKLHTFNIKRVPGVRWRKSGAKNLQLIIIRPIGYRLKIGSKMLYRDPAYLICTDSELNVQKLLQAYIWRWDIEVNFRDEKTLLGCGQAQVRTKESCQNVPSFVTAIYSLLQLASLKDNQQELPRPKWYQKKNTQRKTTGDILNTFRTIKWTELVNINFSDFVSLEKKQQSRKNTANPTLSAMFYARN